MSSDPKTGASSPGASAAPWSGVFISLAFWLTLLLAAGLFAAVSLAPKLAVYLSLEQRHYAQQLELVRLEQQQKELERVIASLKDDPQFAAELARLEFDAVRPGEEILSVDSSLTLDPNAVSVKPAPVSLRQTSLQTWAAILAEHRALRTGLLILAGSLVLLAFGWLQEVAADQVQTGVQGIKRQTVTLWQRYIRPPAGL